jgi:hypothetical protein
MTATKPRVLFVCTHMVRSAGQVGPQRVQGIAGALRDRGCEVNRRNNLDTVKNLGIKRGGECDGAQSCRYGQCSAILATAEDRERCIGVRSLRQPSGTTRGTPEACDFGRHDRR